jgi:ADP-ribose pyrophosphatase YjhB (NUDIX family)
MKKAVRAIVVHDNHLLVMHRDKFGQQYYTLVGGGVGAGEVDEQALEREVREEAQLEVANPRLVFVEEAGRPYGEQHIYYCEYAGGDIALSPDSIEAQINPVGQNVYTPMWLPLAELPDAKFLSETLKQHIIHALKHGFPTQPVLLKPLHPQDKVGTS